MTLVEYLNTLRRFWILILVLGVTAGGAAFLYGRSLPYEYGSRASVMVIPARGDTTGELVQGSNYVQNLVQTYTVVATSPVVLNRVITELGLDQQAHELARQVSVDAPLNTVVINIDVTDRTPEGAQRVADAVAEQLSHAVAELSPQGENGQPAIRMEVIAPARLATVPISPNTRLIVLVGVLAGLALGVAVAVAIRLLGTRLTSVGELVEVTERPVLGEVPATDARLPVPAQVRAAPSGRLAESLRKVVVALRFVDIESAHRLILVTSPSEGEGKTSITLGLALMLAEAGHQVLYVEGDLRRGAAAEMTQLDNRVGLSTVLVGDRSIEEAVQQWGHANLRVLLSGELPPNPAQLLSSERTRTVLTEARERYDMVLVDGAPILPVSDSRWLATLVDGTIMIARLNRTTRKTLGRAMASFDATHSTVLGIIANGVKDRSKSSYYEALPSAIAAD